MIVFREKTKPPKKYGKFFLAREAPGDPNDDVSTINAVPADEYSPAANTRVINVTPGERTRRLVFDDPTEQAPAPTDQAQPTPDQAQDAGATPLVDPNAAQAEAPPLVPVSDDAPAVPTDPAPADPNAPQVADATAADPNAPAPEEGGDGPITDDGGDNLNFSDDPSGDSAGAATPPDDQNQSKGYGIEVDSTRRYALFKDFMALDSTLMGFTERLENTLSDDADQNKAVMQAYKEIKETRDLVHDYMLLRFESSTYAQSLLFYETMYATVQIILTRLEKVQKMLATDRKNNKKQLY